MRKAALFCKRHVCERIGNVFDCGQAFVVSLWVVVVSVSSRSGDRLSVTAALCADRRLQSWATVQVDADSWGIEKTLVTQLGKPGMGQPRCMM